MTDPSPDQPEVLRCRSTADFLAALPQLVGFTALDSVFVVFFSGKRAGRAMRVDLPPSDTPSDSVVLLELICDALHDLGSTQGVVSAPAIVISSGQTFAEAGGPPWRRFARRLERRLRREGLRPRELCCIAPDGWVSYLDPAAPVGGRPLSEIDESPIALEARLRGDASPTLSELGTIPEADPVSRAAVEAALGELAPFDFPGPQPDPPAGIGPGKVHAPSGDPGAGIGDRHAPSGDRGAPDFDRGAPVGDRRDFIGLLADHLEHPPPAKAYAWMADTAEVTRALRDEERPLDPSMTARLIRCAQHPDRWLLLALGVLTRPEFPQELAHEMGPAQFSGVPVNLDIGPPPHRTGWSIRRILASISPDFTEFDRIPEIRRRLLTALSQSPLELRPALLALSAWVWWLGGNHSVAHRQAVDAVILDPGNELAVMVERLVSYPLYLPHPRRESRAA